MPTYDYVCDACGHEFELFQQMSDSVKRKCPECSKMKLRRLIGTGAGVLFKGSGFYETDYRSDSYRKAAESDKKSKDSAKKDGAKKSDAKKPDTKKDASSSSKPAKSSSDGGGSKTKKTSD